MLYFHLVILLLLVFVLLNIAIYLVVAREIMEDINEDPFVQSNNEIVLDNINIGDKETIEGDGEIVPGIGTMIYG